MTGRNGTTLFPGVRLCPRKRTNRHAGMKFLLTQVHAEVVYPASIRREAGVN